MAWSVADLFLVAARPHRLDKAMIGRYPINAGLNQTYGCQGPPGGHASRKLVFLMESRTGKPGPARVNP
ncbi:hypothetical protein SBA6_210045 [Candidatus Sulfopaludibacter sp. SbA6]|nr:hypothetical protein SBA6_210045 [Candidatus Sulfopaludibacter sp. SbA6]